MNNNSSLFRNIYLLISAIIAFYFFYMNAPIQFVAFSVFLLSRTLAFQSEPRYTYIRLLDLSLAVLLLLKAFHVFPLYAIASSLGQLSLQRDQLKGAVFVHCLFIALGAFDLLTNTQELSFLNLSLSQIVLVIAPLSLIFAGAGALMPLATLLSFQLAHKFGAHDLLWVMGSLLGGMFFQLSNKNNSRLLLLSSLTLLWVAPQNIWTLVTILFYLATPLVNKTYFAQVALVGALVALLPLSWLEMNITIKALSWIALLGLIWRYKQQERLPHG